MTAAGRCVPPLGFHHRRNRDGRLLEAQLEVFRRNGLIGTLLGGRQARLAEICGGPVGAAGIGPAVKPHLVAVEPLVEILPQAHGSAAINQFTARSLIHQRAHHAPRQVQFRFEEGRFQPVAGGLLPLEF